LAIASFCPKNRHAANDWFHLSLLSLTLHGMPAVHDIEAILVNSHVAEKLEEKDQEYGVTVSVQSKSMLHLTSFIKQDFSMTKEDPLSMIPIFVLLPSLQTIWSKNDTMSPSSFFYQNKEQP